MLIQHLVSMIEGESSINGIQKLQWMEMILLWATGFMRAPQDCESLLSVRHPVMRYVQSVIWRSILIFSLAPLY